MRHASQSTHKSTGFTLIELLVVIAIIAILAAILFPVFARARENARRTSCLSNLKQIGLGIMQYTQDYDETYPSYGTYIGNTDAAPFWTTTVQPYLKSTSLLRCPSSLTSPTTSIGHYGANILVLKSTRSASETYEPGLKLSAVNFPSSVYMVMDSGASRIIPWGTTQSVRNGSGSHYLPGVGSRVPAPVADVDDAYQDDYQRGRHFLGVNVTYADGHAKWVLSNEVYRQASLCGAWCQWRGANKPVTNSAFNPYAPSL